MLAPLVALLAVSAAAEEVVTAFWNRKAAWGTNRKIGFHGSVIGASGDIATVKITLDNKTVESILHLEGWTNIYTIGPTLFEFSTSDVGYGKHLTATYSADWSYNWRCTREERDGDATCTGRRGIEYARHEACVIDPPSSTEYTRRNLWNSNSTESEDVETVVQTYVRPFPTGTPSFCNAFHGQKITSIPSDYIDVETTFAASELQTMQILITAGAEKLPTKTASKEPESTGMAVPMKTAAPALAGLGAAIVALL